MGYTNNYKQLYMDMGLQWMTFSIVMGLQWDYNGIFVRDLWSYLGRNSPKPWRSVAKHIGLIGGFKSLLRFDYRVGDELLTIVGKCWEYLTSFY